MVVTVQRPSLRQLPACPRRTGASTSPTCPERRAALAAAAVGAWAALTTWLLWGTWWWAPCLTVSVLAVVAVVREVSATDDRGWADLETA